jgi:hypothetical protein
VLFGRKKPKNHAVEAVVNGVWGGSNSHQELFPLEIFLGLLRGDDLERNSLVYCLSAVLDPQLAVDSAVVSFDRIQSQEEPLADFAIGETLGNQLQHF